MLSGIRKKYFSGLSRGTFLLAVSSLFADISTEMLYPIVPIFLTQILMAPASIVGVVEGIATATQYITQGFSGWLSDKLQKRKAIALVGYTLAAFSKPLIGFSTAWPQVVGARFLDRLGSGTRSAPRDALVAASATEESRGKAFGLEGIGDNLGAFLGPIIAVILLYSLSVHIRTIFYLAFIPAAVATFLIFFVREKHISVPKVKIETELAKFSPHYRKYLFVTALFGIGNSSNAFLILRTKDIGVSLETTILIYAFFNLVAALSSYPSGALSDKIGRKNILLFAFLIFILTYLGFAFTKNIYLIAFLFVLYGIYGGIFRAVGKALATDFTPPHLRASGIGWYSAVVGGSGLVASIVAGQLWVKINPQAAFLYGAVFAVLGSIALYLLIPPKKQSR